MKKHIGYPAALSAEYGLSAKDKGSLAEMFERLGLFSDHDGAPLNFQPHAADLLVHAVREWNYFLGSTANFRKSPH